MSMTIQKLICSHFGFKIFFLFFPLENAMILILDKTRKIYLMFLHLFQLLAINEPKLCDSCVYILDFQRNTRRQHALFAMDDTKQHECCELIFLKHFPDSSFLSLTFMQHKNAKYKHSCEGQRESIYVQSHNEVNSKLYIVVIF